MARSIQSLLFALILVLSQSAFAEEIQFNSGNKQVALLELYTSQGCSSCPPADAWLSELKNESGLWIEFVPVALHVSYWDYLGWKDRFSKKEYSSRQRLHKGQGHVKVVYTPGFFLNGKEWKRRVRKAPALGNELTGMINATLSENTLKVNYESSQDVTKTMLNVAILGFGFQTPIKAGENSNRVLNEDFVLLSHLKKHSGLINAWEMELPKQITPMAEKYGLAIWVTQGSDLTPLQATGGWLPDNYFP